MSAAASVGWLAMKPFSCPAQAPAGLTGSQVTRGGQGRHQGHQRRPQRASTRPPRRHRQGTTITKQQVGGWQHRPSPGRRTTSERPGIEPRENIEGGPHGSPGLSHRIGRSALVPIATLCARATKNRVKIGKALSGSSGTQSVLYNPLGTHAIPETTATVSTIRFHLTRQVRRGAR